MKRMPGKQKGGALVTIIVLALIAYGIFVGIQYVPLKIEAGSIDSIFETIETGHRTTPVGSKAKVKNQIIKLLNVNQMDEMIDSFHITQNLDRTVISASFERELNLLYEKKVIKYEKSLTLR